MTQPDIGEADLGTATDVEWLDGHAALTEQGLADDFPEHELTFVWDADLDADTLIDANETEEAPRG